MDCRILIMNGSGCTYKCAGESLKGIEIPKKRKVVMEKVILDKSPDIIFIEESNVALTKICKTEEFGDRNYQAIGPKDNGIIYDTNTFMFVDDPTYRLRKIYETKLNRNESAEIFARMCGRILKGKGVNAQPTLFVCWHGPHKKSVNEKKKVYNDLCLLLSYYVSEKQIPVIIGGDFNLDLYEVNCPLFCHLENHVEHHKLIVNRYEKLSKRPYQIDFVVVSKTIAYDVDCNPFDIIDIIKDIFPDLAEKFLKAVFDHDPLIVDVTIPDCLFWLNHSFAMNQTIQPNYIGHLLCYQAPVNQTVPIYQAGQQLSYSKLSNKTIIFHPKGHQFYYSLPLNQCIPLHKGLDLVILASLF